MFQVSYLLQEELCNFQMERYILLPYYAYIILPKMSTTLSLNLAECHIQKI